MGIDTALALKLSKEMSQRHGLIDGRRKPLVEPHELTGEAFRDLTLTIMQGHPPARVVKAYGFADHADRIQPASAHDCSGGLLKLTDREAASSSG
jgi:type IV secretion system protein VirD4